MATYSPTIESYHCRNCQRLARADSRYIDEITDDGELVAPLCVECDTVEVLRTARILRADALRRAGVPEIML